MIYDNIWQVAVRIRALFQRAESLYLEGIITYPRTETTTYPKHFDLEGTVKSQQESSIWGVYAKQLLQVGRSSHLV